MTARVKWYLLRLFIAPEVMYEVVVTHKRDSYHYFA